MTKVLIVEDSEILREAYQTKLISEGFEIDVAIDGEEALEKAKEINPDVILLDILMPKVDGIEFLKQYDVKNEHPKTKIIVFSNLSNNEKMKEAISLGAAKFFTKATVTPNEIAEEVKKIIK